MNFNFELKNGRLKISECNSCKKIIWPPSQYCNQCFKEVSWRDFDKKGKLLEFSAKKGEFFGIGEFEGSVRIMGKIISKNLPCIGQTITIQKYGISDENCYFEMN